MRRWIQLSVVLMALSFTGCHALIGQRYASDVVTPTGAEAGHWLPPAGEINAGPMGYGTAGCASCGVAPMGVVSPRVRHSCDDPKQCVPYCDRCEGGTVMPLGAMEGMPILERIKSRFVCGDGCGEVYIGEWISTPPTPDPCDNCANFTGECNSMMYRPHRQPVRAALTLVAGVRDADLSCGGCGEVGCSECDAAVEAAYDYDQAPFAHSSGCSCGGH